MCVARAISLNRHQRGILHQQARRRSLPARLVKRARIILHAADGAIDFLKVDSPQWRKDAARPGRERLAMPE